MRIVPLIALLAGCGSGGDDLGFLVEYADFLGALDSETDAVAWELRIEADASAERDGSTRATLRVEGIATVLDEQDFQPVTLTAVLQGGSADDSEIWFPQPGQGLIVLLDHQDVTCSLGEACVWTYRLDVARAAGTSDIALELQSRALLTLGYGDDVPEDAFMRLVVEEAEPGDSGDTGM